MGWWNTAAVKRYNVFFSFSFLFNITAVCTGCALPSLYAHLHAFFCSSFHRYLYFEYNEIHEVDPGTFDSMPSLQLLFLNANLLRSLPLGVFSKVNLSRLNLRNNHLLHLPMAGVLEHLTGLVQVGTPPYSFAASKRNFSSFCLRRPGRHLKE